MKLISIIVPLYNNQKYLSSCLDSIVNQCSKDIEIIIVNDGSTDNSGNIADKYAQKYSFIKVIHQSNRGVSATRNVAIKKSVGKYLVFIDSDDVIYNYFLKKILELIKSDPDIVEINTDLIDKKGKLLHKKIFSLDTKNVTLNNSELAKLRLSKQAKYYLWSRIIKRELVSGLRFNEEISFCEDALYLTECYFRAKKIITVDESLYGYRQHDTNVTSVNSISNIDQLTNLLSIINVKIDNSKNKYYRAVLLSLLINMIHLRKSMYTLKSKKIVCDDVTIEQIRRVKQHYKWSFFKLRNEVTWLRRLSITIPKISNMLISLKSYIRSD